jgi:hypothetical protein
MSLKLVGYKISQWHKKCILLHFTPYYMEISFDPEDLFDRNHLFIFLDVLVPS